MAFPWLASVQTAAAVSVAARRGILDAIAAGEAVAIPELLSDLLKAAGVLRRSTAEPELTPSFEAAWAAGSASIAASADFIVGAAADIATGLDNLLFDLPAFMAQSSTFQLFRYDKAMGVSEQHLAETRPWVSYLEALSYHETPFLVPHIPLRQGDRLLEVGGNTGIMAAALKSTYACSTATVLDLPAVCKLGELSPRSEAVSFTPGDAREADAFAGFDGAVDVILFKSVLHDWPEEDVRDMLTRAIDILPEAGRIIVCERGAYGVDEARDPEAKTLANLVFAPFYRRPDLYREIMQDAGLEVRQSAQEIDMTFHITTGMRT